MPIPTSYTEEELAAYMHKTLRSVAAQLEWSVEAESYDETVNEALLIYGVADIVDATNVRKLRLIAVQEVWRAVLTEVSGDYDYEADGGRFDRSKVFKQADAMFNRAASALKAYLDKLEDEAQQASAAATIGSVAVANEAVW